MTSLPAPIALRGRGVFFALILAAPGALLIGHLLPASGLGLALRLAGAAACVLLVPGALVLRAVGWSAAPAVAVAGALAVSLGVVAVGLALVFLFGTSILLAAFVILAVSLVAFVPAVRREGRGFRTPSDAYAFATTLGLSVLYAGIVWWAARSPGGDGLFHLGRVRKLAELNSLAGLHSVDEFKDGGLHPGYAFPLWHAADALVARLADVDSGLALTYLPAILVPLAFVLAYAAGSPLFDSSYGGLALVLTVVACFGFSREESTLTATGRYVLLSQPQAASLLLLATALLALVFAFTEEGGTVTLGCVLVAALVLSVVHISYTPFVLLLLLGFIGARLLLVGHREQVLIRVGAATAAIAVPFLVALALLIPVISGVNSFTPSVAARTLDVEHYGNVLVSVGRWFVLAPDAIARGGPIVVGGLIAVPLAALAARRPWAAFVLGGTLAVLAALLIPPVFTELTDILSFSQLRRLPQFLPVPFALAGLSLLLAPLRLVGVLLAGAIGTTLFLAIPGATAGYDEVGGLGSAVWVAVIGGVVALAVGALLKLDLSDGGSWCAAAAAALVAPVVISGLLAAEAPRANRLLDPGIVEALKTEVRPGEVVFSEPNTAYEAAAEAPVYVNTSARGHAADTRANRIKKRYDDAVRFFGSQALDASGRRALLARWSANWILVDKTDPYPRDFLRGLPIVYQDGRYALYHVTPESAGS